MVNGHYHCPAALTWGNIPGTRGIECWVGSSVGPEERVALDG